MDVTSTVLDVGVCLLLVSASVGVLTSSSPTAESSSDDAATLVATTTATVSYELEPVAPNGSTPTRMDRQVHGTLAELLASAVIAGATVGEDDLSPGATAFASQVTAATRGRIDTRTQVVAIWEPYPGASERGRVTVGRTPPNDADVSATVVSVPSGGTLRREPDAVARDGGFEALAELLSRTTLDTLLGDARRTAERAGAESVYADGRRTRLASWLDVDSVEQSGGGGRRSRLHDTLADRTESGLRSTYDDPEAAASDVAVDRVRIVVRTW